MVFILKFAYFEKLKIRVITQAMPFKRRFVHKIIFFAIAHFGGLFPSISCAENYLFDLQTIGITEGLPNETVVHLKQDHTGYLWLSSNTGIHRYDGTTFSSWQHPALNLQAPMVASFGIDAENRMWYSNRANTIATDEGGVLDLNSGKILSMKELSGGEFGPADVEFTINPGEDINSVVIATHSGVYYQYDGKLKRIFALSGRVWMSMVCVSAKEGGYWIVNDGTLLRIKDGETLERIAIPIEPNERLTTLKWEGNELVLEISRRTKNRYFFLKAKEILPYAPIGCSTDDLQKVFLVNKDYACFAANDSIKVRDHQGVLLFGKAFNNIHEEKKINIQYRSFEDRHGNIWITTDIGLLQLKISKNPFTILHPGMSVNALFHKNGEVWIAAPPADTLINAPPGRTVKGVTGFYEDSYGLIWMVSPGAPLRVFDPLKSALTFIPLGKGIWGEMVFENPTTHHLWIGTNNGLFLLDTTTNNPSGYLLGENLLPGFENRLLVRNFHDQPEGVWVTTNRGLFLIDKTNEKLIHHYALEDGFPFISFTHLYIDQAGIFWLTTHGGGLIRWDRKNNKFMQFTVNEGLSNDNLYAVYEEEGGILWLSSDLGLMAFDKQTFTTQVFLPHHGVSHERFLMNAHFQDSTGKLFFGSWEGITAFHPSDINLIRESKEAPFLLTSVRILKHKSRSFSDLSQIYTAKGQINLQPDDGILEIKVALLDFGIHSQHEYAYKLTGNQDQWISTNENKITFYNLPYGKFQLHLKARGASGNWSKNELFIPIHIRTPIYLRVWFWVLCSLVLLSIGFLAQRLRVKALKSDRVRLEKEVSNRTMKIEEDKQIILEQAEALRELDEIKSRFFSNITHEFRTPLTLVIGPIEQAIAALSAEPVQTDSIRTQLIGVSQNARNLLELINQLMDLTKLESKSMPVETSLGDLVAYTQRLVSQFQPLATQKQIQLSFSTGMEKWATSFDKKKWNKTVFNLLSNAIKFTPATGKVEVRLKNQKSGEKRFIVLEVEDTGMGLAQGEIKKIFNRFYQVNSSSTRAQEGTGIGLALVKELVELQEGVIEVESTLGEGTAFCVKLPYYPLETEQESSSQHPALEVLSTQKDLSDQFLAEPESQTVSERLQLLLIEDNAKMRSFIRSCLDENKYQIIEAINGEEGIQKAIELVPDLIISDIMMPQKNGFEVTVAIRTHLATSHIPLILLTAKSSLESRLKGLARGADAYLTKPFSPAELVLRIQKLIELRKALQIRYQTQNLEPTPKFQREDQLILELKSFISDNLNNPKLNVGLISVHFGISRTQMYRKIQSLTDSTIVEFILAARMARAQVLLKNSQLNISEIAYEVGYNSPGYFTQSYKKHFGKLPSQLR